MKYKGPFALVEAIADHIKSKVAQSMANNLPPYVGQFVSRELTKDHHTCYISAVKGSRKGGNGTVQYEVTVEDFKQTKSEDILITSGETCNYETQPWQCSVCECFTTCICTGAIREE